MVECPNCGGIVDDGVATCPHCGAAMTDAQYGQQPNRNQQPNQGQQANQPPNQQPRQGRQQNQPDQGQGQPRGQQPRQGQQQPRGQQPQGRQPAPRGGQPQQGPPGGRDTSRRNLLKYGGGAAVIGIGGFLVFDALTGPSGPGGTTQAFYSAIDSGNIQRARNLVHSESPRRGSLFGDSFAFATQSADASVSVDSTEVIEEREDRAVVEADVTVSATQNGQSFEQSFTQRVELRTENGDWKIWDLTTTGF